MARPQAADIFFGVAFLVLAVWNVSSGEPVVGTGFAAVGVAALAAGFIPSVHAFLYRPIWTRRSRR